MNSLKVTYMVTFFVWWIFINKKIMNFHVSLGEPSSQEQRIINASSWSSCLEYCEGTNKNILSIHLAAPSLTTVIHNEGTDNCYQVNIKNEGVTSQYFVWANDFEAFTTWVNTLTNPKIQSLQNTNKLYVIV